MELPNAGGGRERSGPGTPLAGRQTGPRRSGSGILVTLSGLDGSGKTTAATDLVTALRDGGTDALYFYAHRPSYHKEYFQISLSIGLKAVWRRAGRAPEEFRHHPRVKALYDLATFADHLVNQWRIFVRRKPGRILVVDRYLVDVLAYLRFLGPTHPTIERWFTRMSLQPDAAFFFEIGPEEALARKQEQTLEELRHFAEIYVPLREEFRLTKINATASKARVLAELGDGLRDALGLARSPSAPAPEVAEIPTQPRAG